MSEGMTLTSDGLKALDNVCETCLKAKQTRLPFGDKRLKATRPLEIVHTDICGPVDPSTWNKKKYILIFIDNFTNFVMIFLLEGKYEVSLKVKEYALLSRD